MQDTRIHIDSEIGKLNAVMVHRPGREIENMTPASAADVLYDDILNLQLAEREHDQLTGVLRRVATVYEFEDLLRDALGDEVTKGRLIDSLVDQNRFRVVEREKLEFILQEQKPSGREIIIGATESPGLGHLVMFGLGGIFTEILEDVSFRIAPLSRWHCMTPDGGLRMLLLCLDSLRWSAVGLADASPTGCFQIMFSRRASSVEPPPAAAASNAQNSASSLEKVWARMIRLTAGPLLLAELERMPAGRLGWAGNRGRATLRRISRMRRPICRCSRHYNSASASTSNAATSRRPS